MSAKTALRAPEISWVALAPRSVGVFRRGVIVLASVMAQVLC